MEIILLLVILGPIVIFYLIKRSLSKPAQMFCPKCGTLALPKKVVRGSFGIEILLWFFFIIPGMIYTQWRTSGDTRACPACGSRELIPPNSPIAQRMMAQGGGAAPFQSNQ